MEIKNVIKKSAANLFSDHPEWPCLYVNERGEFFTREDYASNSVEGDKKKFLKIERQDVENLAEPEQVSAVLYGILSQHSKLLLSVIISGQGKTRLLIFINQKHIKHFVCKLATDI